jgi:hypothetical protein
MLDATLVFIKVRIKSNSGTTIPYQCTNPALEIESAQVEPQVDIDMQLSFHICNFASITPKFQVVLLLPQLT